jgi:hypothetical protein
MTNPIDEEVYTEDATRPGTSAPPDRGTRRSDYDIADDRLTTDDPAPDNPATGSNA